MKILYSWLKDFINIELNPGELAEKLTLAGHEVETIEKHGEDFIFDLEITPNRGDCLSHLGIAREVFAIANGKRKTQSAIRQLADKTQNYDNKLEVAIDNANDCSKYIGRYITGVKIMPSPDWIQTRLKAIEIQPINNVVDATNYVLFAMGQPLHAFDAKTLSSLEIAVRRAKSNEEIITLDGQKRKLDKDILVIADSKKPIAVAGIMGGLESGVTNKTTDIILEAAVFDPKLIRQGSKKLKLVTEASYRFERGVDYEGVEQAMEKATGLILNSGGGTIRMQNAKCKMHLARHARRQAWQAGNDKEKFKNIKFDARDIKRVLGLDVAPEKIKAILFSLGFQISSLKSLITGDQLLITAPPWRHDINIKEDLIEEVARIYGYDKISQNSKLKTQNYNSKLKTGEQKPSLYEKKEIIKNILANMGLQEAYNYSFVSEEDIEVCGLDKSKLWELENPLSPELKYMRPSLIPGLLKSVAKNPDFDPVEIFEIGNVFTKGEKEKTMLGICSAGGKRKMEDIIHGLLNELINSTIGVIPAKAGIQTSRLRSKNNPGFRVRHGMTITDIDGAILKHYKIRKLRVQVAEIDINKLADKVKMPTESYFIPTSRPQYKEISKFPSVTRDLAIVINKDIHSTIVTEMIKTVDTAVLIVELFDEYENSVKFGPNKKSLAFHIVYQNLNKTLSDSEADKIHGKIIKRAEKEFKAELRR